MNVLEAAARKAIDGATRDGDTAWAAGWNRRAIRFVAARDEHGARVAVEVHDRQTWCCGGCQYEATRGVRQVVVIIMR